MTTCLECERTLRLFRTNMMANMMVRHGRTQANMVRHVGQCVSALTGMVFDSDSL